MNFRKREVALVHDTVMAGLSLAVALFLRVGDGVFSHHYSSSLTWGVPIFMVISIVVFRAVGMYRGLWRYSSVPDLVSIVKGVTLAILVFLPVLFLVNRLETMPRTIPLIQWMVLIMMLGAPRLAYRLLRNKFSFLGKPANDSKRIPVLLYGAGDGAEIFIRSCKSSTLYQPVGILDDNHKTKGLSIHSIPVLGGADNLDKILKRLKSKKGLVPQKIIITDDSVLRDNADTVRQITEMANEHGLSLGRLPDLSELKGLSGGVIPLRPIAIEDLLGRPQIIANMNDIAEFLRGKRIVVTGAGGSIGSEIVRQVVSFGPASMMLIDNGEHNLYQIDMDVRTRFENCACIPVLADVRNRGRVFRLFEEYKPHVVFHAAAYKHVPMVEYNPTEGVLTNAVGTQNVADAALSCGVEAMVQISTDKAVNPTNIMGATKRIAEAYAQALDISQTGTGQDKHRGTRIMTVRFGNVLGSSGSVVPLFRKQLERGGPLTVTDPDIERYFMTIPEAVGLVLSASAHGLTKHAPRGQIFVLDMGKPVRIVDIARQMIRLAGLRPDKDIEIKFTGLRPGEKMFEELFDSQETLQEIGLPGVRAANPRPFDLETLRTALETMCYHAEKDDVKAMIDAISNIVPGFNHQSLLHLSTV